MTARNHAIPKKLRDILDESGREWGIVEKRRHNQLVIEGEVVLTYPRASWKEGAGRRTQNALACVRRAIRPA